MNSYGAGSLVKIEWEYRNESDQLINPTAAYLYIKNPNDVEEVREYGVDLSVVRDATGTYYSCIDTTGLVGLWVCEAYSSTGTAQAHSKEWEFRTE